MWWCAVDIGADDMGLDHVLKLHTKILAPIKTLEMDMLANGYRFSRGRTLAIAFVKRRLWSEVPNNSGTAVSDDDEFPRSRSTRA
jgi:hypothetical protein